MKPLKLSVIIPNYNHSRYIFEALDSIVKQSFTPFEVIVCDDASTDNSVEIIQKFVEKYSYIHLIKNETNIGPIRNCNKLVALVSGDYLFIQTADDKILPGFFEKSMNLLQKYPDAGLCSTLVKRIDEDGNPNNINFGVAIIQKDCFIDSKKAHFLLYTYGTWIAGPSTIYKYSDILENGGFNEKLHGYCDGFLAEVIAVKKGACFIHEELSCWRVSNSSYAATTRSNFDFRIETINIATDLMKGIFSDKFITTWKVNELFCLEKDRLLFYRDCNLTDIEKTDSGTFLKVMSKFKVNIVFVFLFVRITIYHVIKHARYINFVKILRSRFQRVLVV